MAVDNLSSCVTQDYRSIFHIYVANQTRQLLNKVWLTTTALATPIRLQAWHTLTFALRLPEVWPSARDLLLVLAPKMEQEGFRDEWMPFLERGISQSQDMGDLRAEAELTLALGRLKQLQSQYECATRRLQQSAACFQALEDHNGQAKAFNQLAFVARRQADYQQARQLGQAALNLLDCDHVERANSFYILGAVAFDERDWSAAEQFYREALAIRQASHDMLGIARGYRNLANVLGRQKKYEQAMDYYKRTIELLEEVQDPVNLAIAHMNLGTIYLSLDQPSHALILFAQAEAAFHKIQDERQLAMVYTNQGMAYRKLRKWSYAQEALHKSMQRWQQLGNVRSLINAMDELGLVYLAQGCRELAITTYDDALSKLKQMTGQPGYERLKQLLTTHRGQAMNGVIADNA